MTKKGALIFAHNNHEIDYILIAIINALMIRKNLKIPVTVISDDGTINYAKSQFGSLLDVFDEIKTVDIDYEFQKSNKRIFRDTSHTSKRLSFYNLNRYMAYSLSPYDETLLIDGDYLIMSDSLNHCFGSNNDLMINNEFKEILHSRNTLENRIEDSGIPLWWATAVYFKKNEICKNFFEIVESVAKNIRHYKQLYSFPRNMFRNDFAFSVASHITNNYSNIDIVKKLPNPIILKSTDYDDIVNVNGMNDITFLAAKQEDSGFILTNIKDVDVHVMNKWAIVRHAKDFIKHYE